MKDFITNLFGYQLVENILPLLLTILCVSLMLEEVEENGEAMEKF